MKQPKNLLAAGLTLVLIGCVAGYFATRGTPPVRKELPSLIDQRILKTARQLTALADTNDEQDQAREALRLANSELDLAFAGALRQAETADANAGVTASQQQLATRIAALQAKVASGQSRVAELTKQGTAAANQLDLAKAQLELDQDDMGDAQQDLARAGGDLRSRLEAALQQHEAAKQTAVPVTRPAPLPPAGTFKDQVQQWSALRGKHAALLAAQEQANSRAASLERAHNQLESQADAPPPAASQATDDTSAALARMRTLSGQKKTLSELDRRIQVCQQLTAAYQGWSALVDVRQLAMLHLLLRSLAAIFAVVLALVLAHRFAVHLIRGQDRRQRHLLEVASAIACQFVAAIAILLIVFGAPTQLSTILGLATAGLTVVFKDFIVGFIGWFVLMGRNGVRIGDWVEINGVGGEVIEIGVFKTILLEMGNWTNTGHPTGRRVSFSNSYAIEGHYFNFSTVGQWLWDELQVTLPPAGNPYQVAEQIRQTVERETAAASVEAEQDWERVTAQYGVSSFSAKPAIDLRPNVQGLDVVVRYITRAPMRYEVKSKLFQEIVALLHGGAETQAS
jgi:small-conductance mechanosensitive channel